MILLAAAIILSQPQTITFTHPCANSAVVLDALGEQLNLTLKPSGSVNKDYFLVSFNEVPVQEAFDKIAETLNATWTRKGDVTYLGRSRAQEITDFETEYDAKKAAITRAIARLDVGDLTPENARSLAIQSRDFGGTSNNDDWERYQPIARQLPGNRAMFRLIKLLDLDTVVKALGSSIKLSKMSDGAPLPNGADAVLRQMRQEWAVIAQEAGIVGIAPDDSSIGVYLRFASTSPVLTDRLQLSVHPSDGRVLFMLSFLSDRKWENIGYYTMSYAEETAIPKWLSQLTEPAKMEDSAFESLAPSTLGQESPVLQKALLSSESADVALSAPGAVLLQAAEQMDVSLVAQLPDSAYLALAKAKVAKNSSVAQMLTLLLTERALAVEKHDGWLTVKPLNPYTARRRRMDRRAFTAMFGHAVQHGSIPLDVFATFAATTLHGDPVVVANQLLARALELRLGLPTIGIANLRIYGLLTAAERRQAKSESVTLTRRPDANRFVLALGMLAAQYVDAQDQPSLKIKRPFREYEEALALIANDDKWTVSVRDEGFLQLNLLENDISSFSTFMDVHSFAMNLVSAERPGRPATTVDYSAMAPVYGATVYLGFERQGGGGQSFGRYADPIGDAVFGSINDLPADIRSRLHQEIENWRKRMSGGGRR
ncbi:MAG: hypothetical protein IH945_06780 [Armatimonadetes bacterium]|nr:hypothetical protein [Armatimonadota bacterium]